MDYVAVHSAAAIAARTKTAILTAALEAEEDQ
jgi:hypothetical protein